MAALSAELILVYGGLGKDGQPLTDGILLDSQQKIAVRTFSNPSFGFCCVYNRCYLTKYNAIVAAVSALQQVKIVQIDLADFALNKLREYTGSHIKKP